MRYIYISLFLSVFALNANAQIITTVAGDTIGVSSGNGSYSGDGGQATAAGLNAPMGIAIDGVGNLYIADTFNDVIRKVNTNGIITTIAGGGSCGIDPCGDGGQATAAKLNNPDGIVIDILGNLYFADNTNNLIRKINTLGIITTIAGNGYNAGSSSGGFSGDGGQATNAALYLPDKVAIDNVGNLYFSDYANNRVRKVNSLGIINTVAGNGSQGFSGDGGQATNAELYYPSGIAFDEIGNLCISDSKNNRVRKINSAGIIITIVGNGIAGYSGDGGSAISAELYETRGIAFDAIGNLYIADIQNNVIRMVDSTGIITTVAGDGFNAGTGNGGYSGDGGQATLAELYAPMGVTVDGTGNLYIADYWNNCVRMVTHIGHTTGIEAFTNTNEQVTVYPNPASNNIQVSFSGNSTNAEITVTDMLGNTIKQFPFNTEHVTLSIGDIGEGVYNISITGKEGVANKRVVIVR